MNKNVFKIIFAIFIVTTLVAIPYVSYADGVIRDVSASLPGQVSEAQYTTKMAISLIRWVGYACAIGMVIFIGIKYVLASADEKASLKGMLVKVAIGCVILVSAVEITDAVINVMGGNAATNTSGNTGTTTSTSSSSSSSSTPGSSIGKPSKEIPAITPKDDLEWKMEMLE